MSCHRERSSDTIVAAPGPAWLNHARWPPKKSLWLVGEGSHRPRPRPCLSLSSTQFIRGPLRFGWLAFAVAFVATSAVFAADTMAPSEIQATFFTGQAFTARTPSGTKFKMTFTPDGKMTREPLAQSGNAKTGTGTWKLSAKGFCTTWAHSKPTCFTVVPTGENKWSVQRTATTIATTVSVWSK